MLVHGSLTQLELLKFVFKPSTLSNYEKKFLAKTFIGDYILTSYRLLKLPRLTYSIIFGNYLSPVISHATIIFP